jgi:hypothetical protein
MKRNFNILIVFLCILILKVHRHVFDIQYQQYYRITLKDKPILLWYKFLVMLFPEFRQYLKWSKVILTRAYNQKRLSIIKIQAFWVLRKINVERYSSY